MLKKKRDLLTEQIRAAQSAEGSGMASREVATLRARLADIDADIRRHEAKY